MDKKNTTPHYLGVAIAKVINSINIIIFVQFDKKYNRLLSAKDLTMLLINWRIN
jgi:hypothetical protein